MNKFITKLSKFTGWSIVLSAPLVVLIPFLYCGKFPYGLRINSIQDRDIEATLSSAWTAYSFAALFFILAMPISDYLKKIRVSKVFYLFSFIIALPAIIGTLHLLLIIIGSGSSTLEEYSVYLFFAQVIYSLYSLLWLFIMSFNNK